VTYTAPATVSTGGTSTAAQFNAAMASVAALASRCSMSYEDDPASSIGFTIAASSTAKLPVTMTADADSPDGMLDLPNQRIVIRQAGTYRIFCGAGTPGGNPWTLFVRKNGTGSLMSVNGFGAGVNQELDWAFPFIVGDYLELWATNPNAFPLVVFLPCGTVGDDTTWAFFRAEWIAP
jgi:hypothetical protein